MALTIQNIIANNALGFIYGAPISFSNLKSVSFDGVDEYVNLGTISTLNNLTTVTMSCWIKFNSIIANVYPIGYYTGASNPQMYFQSSVSGQLGVVVANATVYLGISQTTGTLTTGVWYNLVGVYDASLTPATSALKLYLDGTQISPITDSSTGIPANLGTTSAFTIGGLNGGSLYENCYIDEVSLFDYAMTSGEVTALYNSGCPNDLMELAVAKRPEHYYRMGDGDTYPTIIDNGETGGNDGTMTNMESGDIIIGTVC